MIFEYKIKSNDVNALTKSRVEEELSKGTINAILLTAMDTNSKHAVGVLT